MKKTENERFEEVFDKIMRWYRSDGERPLSADLEARRLRWLSAREWILAARPLTDSGIVNFLMATHQISEPQAWRDVRDCKRFFSSMEAVNQEFDKIMLKAQIQDARAQAMRDGKYSVVAQCDANLIKLGGYDQPKVEEDAGRNITLNLTFDPKLVGAKEMPNLLSEVTKFIGEDRARRELMITDIDHEDLPTDER